MACPFAQLSPVLLLSLLVLLFNYGAALLPKPLATTFYRGLNAGRSTPRGPGTPPGKHHGGGDRAGDRRGGGRSLLGISPIVAPPAVENRALNEDPLPWDGTLSTGGELFFARMLRWQAGALKEGLRLDRVACPEGLESVCNIQKGSRVANSAYSGDRVRLLRLSYLDTPGMQVFSSLVYGRGGNDFPILGVSAMAMGKVRVLAMDMQPLFEGPEYAEKYRGAANRMAELRAQHPQMGQELVKDYYKGSPFFSDNMLYARWGPEEEAAGFVESEVMTAFQGCVRAFIDVVNGAEDPDDPTGVLGERVQRRQNEFDRYHADREQAHPVIKANFGSAWADAYISKFLFAGADKAR